MSANKWTPGPWGTEIAEYGSRHIGTVFGGGLTIAQICGPGAGPRSGPTAGFGALTAKTDANARLIAAAPELAAACEALLDGCGEHSVGCKEPPPGYDESRCCPVHIARAALAKARGES